MPFANLLMPFRAMAETWRITHRPAQGSVSEAPTLLKWWWGLFLLTNILGNAQSRLLESEIAGVLVLGDELIIVSSLLAIPLCVVLVRIVRELSAAQSARLAAGDATPPTVDAPDLVTA